MKDSQKICFLCGKPIEGKATEEHIFSNSFLAEFDLKRERLRYGEALVEYSRLKPPAHSICNNEYGSKFEDYVLKITRSMDFNLDVLSELHRPNQSEVAARIKEALCQWLAKILLGLIFWETNLKRHADLGYQASLVQHIKSPLFSCLHRCLTQDHWFNCPSSLYYFSVPDPPHPVFRFNFATSPEISSVFVRFGRHLLVTTIGDGKLTEEWFGDDQYARTQAHITEKSPEDPVAYLWAVAAIWAVRELLPISPRLEFTTESVIDRSREGVDIKPEIDGDAVRARTIEWFDDLSQRYKSARPNSASE